DVLKDMTGQIAQPLAGARANAALVSDFGAWMAGEQRRVFGLCMRLLQDQDEANSATQDVFLKAFQALSKEDAKDLDDPARWITRIGVNACLDRLRSRKWQFWRRRPSPVDENGLLLRARTVEPDADETYFAGQISSRIQQALERLSARQRAVFTLRHYE